MAKREGLLYAAEVVDAFRLVPRVIVFGYCAFVFWITKYLLDWYTVLPATERTIETSGFAAGIFTAITGLCGIFINAYLKTGRDWTKKDGQSHDDNDTD